MGFSESQVQQVWEKGFVTPTKNPKKWRKDNCGAWIYRPSYGKNSRYGWLIDHIKPETQDAEDELSNLQPLHWENNLLKTLGNRNCVLTSKGNKNVRKLIDKLPQIV